MTKSFVFIGDPGPEAPELLEMLKSAGLVARRMPPEAEADAIAAEGPVAVVLPPDLPKRDDFMGALRERPPLAAVPVIQRLASAEPDPPELERAFHAGVDDYLPRGSRHQFSALLAAVQKADTWEAVRAPAGQVVLAHEERLERVRYGAILRRNGYDPYFAAALDETVEAADRGPARAVVVSSGLPGGDVLEWVRARGGAEAAPVVLLAPRGDVEGLGALPREGERVRLLDAGADAASLTFLLNELLSPAPPRLRRSPRLLYHTPVAFRPEVDEAPVFHGYSYNVNRGGLFVRTLAPLPLQTRMEIRFRPPFGRGRVSLTAQVVWRKELGDAAGAATPAGMGVQIVDAPIADEAGYEAGYTRLLERSQEGLASIPATPPA